MSIRIRALFVERAQTIYFLNLFKMFTSQNNDRSSFVKFILADIIFTLKS